mmetsp:Transcript_53044/g.113385  ORF Transcript_53044/g.113385 Transcript_53044/m.113385 type:complete len:250 (+) Transcript_53044:328-1077(+)
MLGMRAQLCLHELVSGGKALEELSALHAHPLRLYHIHASAPPPATHTSRPTAATVPRATAIPAVASVSHSSATMASISVIAVVRLAVHERPHCLLHPPTSARPLHSFRPLCVQCTLLGTGCRVAQRGMHNFWRNKHVFAHAEREPFNRRQPNAALRQLRHFDDLTHNAVNLEPDHFAPQRRRANLTHEDALASVQLETAEGTRSQFDSCGCVQWVGFDHFELKCRWDCTCLHCRACIRALDHRVRLFTM